MKNSTFFRAAGTCFNMVRTDPLEMDSLASSDPIPPSLQPTYLPILFIISTLILLKNPTHRQGFKKFQLLSQIHLYYCVFHQADKMKETNWTQMRNRKSTNTHL